MKNRPSCRSEYNRGLDQRREHPLHEGIYKINECEGYPKRILETIKSGLHSEASETLRSAPAWIAFELGWRFLPAVEALPGDGVPEAFVANRLPTFERAALQIVDLCQNIADEFAQTPISRELRRIRSGHVSRLVYPFRMYIDQIEDAKSLFRFAGRQPPHQPRPTMLRNATTGALHVGL